MVYRLGVKPGASKRECCLAPRQEFALAPEVVPEVGQAGRREVMCMFQWYAHGRGKHPHELRVVSCNETQWGSVKHGASKREC